MIFRVADLRANAARRVILGGQTELQKRALHGGSLIVVIVNREIARKAEVLRFAPQQARAKGMKRGNPDIERAAAAGAQKFADALLHHARGFVRERDGENRTRRHALLDQMRHAIGDHARLARARAREHQQRPFGSEHSFALAFVEAGDEWRLSEENCSSTNSIRPDEIEQFHGARVPGRRGKLCYNRPISSGFRAK